MLIQQCMLHIVYKEIYQMMTKVVVPVTFSPLQLYHGTDFVVFVIVLLIVGLRFDFVEESI